MLEVQLPKNNVIAKVLRRPLQGGLFHGSYGLDIRLAPYMVGAEFGDAFGKVLLALLDVRLPASLPLVRITGADIASWPESVIGSLIDALTHYGRQVQIILHNGSAWPAWLTDKRRVWIIVQTSNPLVVIPASEIWYAPVPAIVKDGEPDPGIEDVTLLPGASLAKVYMYLDVAQLRLSEEAVADFVIGSRHAWAMF